MAKAPAKTVKLEQIASASRRPTAQQATLIGLGLNRIRKQSELIDTPSVRGMIAKVQHLVRVIG